MTAPATRTRPVGPWPDRPRYAPREPACTAPRVDNAFPSGRAAILACLEVAGIGPDSGVATPECVTGCLNDAVRRRARPIPLRAAVDSSTQPSAAIVYEQWGWPLPPEAEGLVCDRFAGVPVIIDRVDSADFFSSSRTCGAFEVLSLSKVLGIDAGGIARRRLDGALLRFAPGVSSRRAPRADHPRLLAHPAVRELFKQSEFVHPSAIRWLADNCAITALEAERQARSTVARLILDSELSAGWPTWMPQAIESGAGPVWAPVLRGRDPDLHRRAIISLERSLGIRAAVRMFNWSGNPLEPRYEPSIALPIHSGVDHPAEVVFVLECPGGCARFFDKRRPV